MPCRCYGVNLNKCSCKVFGYPVKNYDSNIVLMANSESLSCTQNSPPKRNIIVRAAERAYEKCAGYNLRYCQLRGFVNADNCFSSAVKDFFLLACFLVANSVVLLAILTKIACHVYFFVAVTSQSIKRYLSQNQDLYEVVPVTIDRLK